MTLKTVTGPSIRDALADARRLFGADVVMLQSAPAAHGQPASVTVAFDTDLAVAAPAAATPPASASRRAPAAASPPAPRTYGYGPARNVRPAPAEPVAAPTGPPAPAEPAGTVPAGPDPTDGPGATAAELAALRARLAEVEAMLAEVRAASPAPQPSRPPVVFVGPSGSGKTSLALRLSQRADVVGAERPAAILVAGPERAADPAPLFWAAGVPVAVVETADDVREALRTFADADLLVVDTPSLPLVGARAPAVVARLGAVLAPLGAVEVHLVIDATRAASARTAQAVAALGLRPDALALTRLDEAPERATTWAGALGLPLRLTAAGPDDLALAAPAAHVPAAPPLATPASPPLARPSVDLRGLVWSTLGHGTPTEAPLPVA